MTDDSENESHEAWEALAAVRAVGVLTRDEMAALEEHLIGCDRCRERLEGYRRVTSALDQSVPLVPVPARVESALRPRLRAERPSRMVERRGLPAWRLAAIAALLLAVVLGTRLVLLNRELALAQHEQEILLRTLASPEVQPLPALAAGSEETVGYFIWAPGIRTGTLTVQGLPPSAPERAYQFWLVRDDGTTDNGGMIEWQADGRGYLQVDSQVPWPQYDHFLITEEPAPGSPAPTSDAVVSGRF